VTGLPARTRLSARTRLTVLYAALFTLGGAALITATYLLVAHTLRDAGTIRRIPAAVQLEISRCLNAAQTGGAATAGKCSALYTQGVQAGAGAQRATTLAHLLAYSLLSLAVVAVLAAVVGWLTAGRILRPVHQLTAAARAATEHNLSQRIALQGPRDELRELADTFDTMLERLDRAFSTQRQFIANASHELRTPLTLMRTATDVVLAKPRPTVDELVAMAAEVRQAVGHCQRLIDALLILARTDHKPARTEPLDLAAVAEDALDGRAPAGVTITATLGEAPVTGDAVLLERLIVNLLDNAERYNTDGGTITITTAASEAESVLRVVNSGPVIPPEQVTHLFEPFTRLHDRTRHDGSGLGLALVASITSAHHGTLRTTAPATGGLDITIGLPRRYLGREPNEEKNAGPGDPRPVTMS